MKVAYNYLNKQFAKPDNLLKKAVKVVKTGLFTLGSELEEFEKKFAKFHDVKHATGVANGTDALMLIMKALGIGYGNEVITAPNSFIATAGAIAIVGAKPVFVDVKEDYTINPELIEKEITKNTKAIIPVHLTGNPANMKSILKIADKHKLFVIEDAAQAVTAVYKNKPVGSWGTASAFSLHPLKNLNIWGDGGVVTTNDDDLNKKIRLWRNHGLRNRDECDFFAHNARLDTIQAAVGLVLLDGIKKITSIRKKNADFYDKSLRSLAPKVVVPSRQADVQQVFHTYVVQVENRPQLIEFLNKAGIETKIHYSIPIHLQKAAQYLGYKKGSFPVTESQSEKILSLPIHQYLTKTQLSYVVEKIREFYNFQP